MFSKRRMCACTFLQSNFLHYRIRVSKGLLHNLYWQIAQKKYGKFLFVQFDSTKLKGRSFDTRIITGNVKNCGRIRKKWSQKTKEGFYHDRTFI